MRHRRLAVLHRARPIAVGVAGVVALAAIAACGPPKSIAAPPPQPAGPACVATMASPGSSTSVGNAALGAPLSAPAATAEATEAYAANADSPQDSVPIVTVEKTATGPRIESHDVSSSSQAATVAARAASGSDLVSVEFDGTVTTAAVTNDPSRNLQWAMTSTAFGDVFPTLSGSGVKVAIVDTGVDATHPDLAGQVLPGCSFLTSLPTGQAGASDDNGHGTHVAGIAGAVTNNGVGIAGGAPGIAILPVKVLNGSGSGSYSDVANGIVFAANNGAKVINLSLGGTQPSITFTTAVAYARSVGAVVVAAGGNGYLSEGNQPSYPGATPGVLAVAAVDSGLQRASFSNTGAYIDLSAPGVNIFSTTRGAGYASWSGTSMATPFVAAAAAVVFKAHPTCTPDGVEQRLRSGAFGLGTPTAFGSGLVNPVQAASVPGC